MQNFQVGVYLKIVEVWYIFILTGGTEMFSECSNNMLFVNGTLPLKHLILRTTGCILFI